MHYPVFLEVLIYELNIFLIANRGISSVVRKCIHKITGKPYAVKIIDKLSDAGVDIEATTRDEVSILLALQGHENISKWPLIITIFLFLSLLPIFDMTKSKLIIKHWSTENRVGNEVYLKVLNVFEQYILRRIVTWYLKL